MALAGCGPARAPFVDLAPHLDLAPLDAVHEEICLALARLPSGYTGGSHRSMEIVPTRRPDDVYGDYGEVFRALDDDGLRTLAALGEDPGWTAPLATVRAQTIGEERALPLSRAQQRWLEVRHGVYFPWTTFHELLPVGRWEEKDELLGKEFTREARAFFPKTIAFLRGLPLAGIGRASILGVAPFHHGTVHRDGDPSGPAAEFLLFAPGGDTQLFLWDDDDAVRHDAPPTRALWFHDGDFHGVAPAPRFRYTLRVDGPFTEPLRAAIAAVPSTAVPR